MPRTRYSQIASSKGLLPMWRENFSSVQSVINNGGIVSGTITINNGMSNGAIPNSGGVRFPGIGPSGTISKFSIRTRFKTDPALSTNITSLFTLTATYPGTSNTLELYLYSKYIEIQISDFTKTSPYGDLVGNTIYEAVVTYDGSLAAGSRVAMYLNGSSVVMLGVAAPTFVSVTQPTIGVFADPFTASNICVANVAIYEIEYYDIVLTEKDANALYNKTLTSGVLP